MASSRQIERAAAAWLARRDAGTWSADDQARLTAWLEASVAHRVALLRLQAAWQHSARLRALGAGHDMAAREQWLAANGEKRATHAVPNEPPARSLRARSQRAAHRSWPLLRYAAVVLLALSLTLVWRHYTAVEEAAYATAIGSLQVVRLADGSTATLNSASRVHVALSRGERTVDLQQGEAFFEVAKDPTRPFVVNAGGRRVTAVGTAFAVRRDSGALRVVVTHGVVRLEAIDPPGTTRQATTLLPAGSVALADAAGVLVRSGPVQRARDFLSWRDGYLRFHDTPLAVAAAEFNRYNTRKIVIADPAVGELRVGGTFRWSNADAFVRLLEQGFPVRVVRRDQTLLLQHR